MGVIFSEGKSFNKFLLEERLGEGSIGQVWRAKDTIIGRTAALKILDPEAEKKFRKKGKNLKIRETFTQEAGNLGRLQPKTREDHKLAERIAQVYEANIDQRTGLMYIAQEFVEGETLAKALKKEGKIDARKTMEQILEGLQYAHEKGVIHRDLSIHNIMISPTGARIIDFGIGSLGIPTSILYTSPELIQKPENASPQTDMWSAGVIAYRITRGRFPFRLESKSVEDHDKAKTTLDDVVKTSEEYEYVKRQILEKEIEKVSLIKLARSPLERAIKKLLEKNPGDRPKSAYKAKTILEGHEALITYAKKMPIYAGITVGALYLLFAMSLSKDYMLAVNIDNKKILTAYANPEHMGKIRLKEPQRLPSRISKRENARMVDFDKKYVLMVEPEIMVPSKEGRYLLYGNTASLYILDTSTGDSNKINVQPANNNGIFFGRKLHIIDDKGRHHSMDPRNPNATIPANIKQVINGDIIPEEIIQVASDGKRLFYSTKTNIYDEESDYPLIEGRHITHMTYVEYKTEKMLFYMDEGVQYALPMVLYYDRKARSEEKPMPELDKESLIAAPMERAGMKILEEIGKEWFLITVNGQKHLWNSRMDRTYAPPFIESAKTIASIDNRVFFTAEVNDETGDGIIDEKDSKIFVYDANREEFLDGPMAAGVAIIEAEYED